MPATSPEPYPTLLYHFRYFFSGGSSTTVAVFSLMRWPRSCDAGLLIQRSPRGRA
ncbi:hypothetical protein ACFPRL_01120 [Pseudoclavibacter helvolus]